MKSFVAGFAKNNETSVDIMDIVDFMTFNLPYSLPQWHIN